MDRISGSYPGGPKKRDPDDEPSEPPSFETVESVEERMRRGTAARGRVRRRRRLRIGLLVAVVVSGLGGLVVGYLSHRTTEDLTREREEERMRSFDPSSEVNRMLIELWKMEDVERAPRAPGGRR